MGRGKYVPTADPGGEICNAPYGTVEWAQRVRLELQSMLNHIHVEPENVDDYLRLVRKERMWTKLNRKDGSMFRTFDEFCEYEQPWGLGRPYREIEPYLVALHGKQGAGLETVTPGVDAKEQPRGDDGRFGPFRHDGGTANDRSEQRLRAILRADPYIRDLYRQGLVSQTVAAKMGPAKKTDEQAATLNSAVNTVRTYLKPERQVKEGADPKQVRRSVDRRLREILGEQSQDPVDRILKLVGKLDRRQRRRLMAAIQKGKK
jgi:hypothetical protein